MPRISVDAEGSIAAPADRVYRLLANYNEHHPRILPPQISNLVVESGGIGEGTVIRFETSIGGRKQQYHQRVSEPEPGAVLRESDIDGNQETTFSVRPEGQGSRLRIESTWQSSGVKGAVERLLAPRLLRPVFAEEIGRINQYAQEHPEI